MKFSKIILISTAIFSCSLVGYSQREVRIPPGINTITTFIAGDTTETGDRFDINTVYLLERNGVYKNQFEVINPGFPLTVRAEDGAGARPIMQPTPLEGGEINRAFTVSSDLTLEGIYLTNYADNGNFDTRIIRATGRDIKIVTRDCWFDGTGQSVIRFDSPNATAIMENCIISHVGRPNNTGNGRVIDVRGDGGIGADTIIMRNNTFYNITRRLIRFNQGLGAAYARIDHNTFVNSVVQFITLDQSLNVEVTNNLLINPSFEGEARTSGTDMIEIDSLNQQAVYEAAGYDSDRRFFCSNNWIYWQPAVREVWADSVNEPQIYNDGAFWDIVLQDGSELELDTAQARQLLNSEPYLFQGEINLANAPEATKNVVIGIIQDARTIDNRDLGEAPQWNYTPSPWYRILQENLTFPWEFPYDFSYDIDEQAATSSTTGGPLGDPRWTPRQIDIVVGIEDEVPHKVDYYPNPFLDRIQIKSSIPLSMVKLFDQSGRQVSVTFSPAGKDIDVSNLSPGIYFINSFDQDGNVYKEKLIKK